MSPPSWNSGLNYQREPCVFELLMTAIGANAYPMSGAVWKTLNSFICIWPTGNRDTERLKLLAQGSKALKQGAEIYTSRACGLETVLLMRSVILQKLLISLNFTLFICKMVMTTVMP